MQNSKQVTGMMLFFSVKNFRSINTTQTLNFVVDKDRLDLLTMQQDIVTDEETAQRYGRNSVICFIPALAQDIEIRKSIVLSGANASGKSNMLKAMQSLFTGLFSGVPMSISMPEWTMPYFNSNQLTEFELCFMIDGGDFNNDIFVYKFSIDNSNNGIDIAKRFISCESLSRIVDRKKYAVGDDDCLLENTTDGLGKYYTKYVFCREYNYETNQAEYSNWDYEFLFGEKQRQAHIETIQGWNNLTTTSQLLITVISNNYSVPNNPIKQIFDYINLRKSASMGHSFLFPDAVFNLDALNNNIDYVIDSKNKHILENLRALGMKFDKINKLETPKGFLFPGFAYQFPKQIVSEHLHHNNAQLDFVTSESDGTSKSVIIMSWVDQAIHHLINMIMVDEIESHVHHLIVQQIFRIWHGRHHYGQLICTTHDPLLFNDKIFCRDQLYIVDKIDDATDIAPISSYNGLKATADILTMYLSGQLGSIPDWVNIQ